MVLFFKLSGQNAGMGSEIFMFWNRIYETFSRKDQEYETAATGLAHDRPGQPVSYDHHPSFPIQIHP